MDVKGALRFGPCPGSLISPPNSPYMSAHPVTSGNFDCYTDWPRTGLLPISVEEPAGHVPFGLGISDAPTVDREGRSLVRPQSQLHAYEPAKSPMENSQTLPSPAQTLAIIPQQRSGLDPKNRVTTQGADRTFDKEFEKLAQARAFPRFVLDIKVADAENELDYDDEYAMTASDLDENVVEGENTKTLAEVHAEGRKMKRFRLTHSQTRFLQSEFARQAHPDAAQRDRLSREIPGLSSRQVQVWFQNRRAKLKRLTIDDRERITKSRVLPEDFDTTQALHSTLVRPLGRIGAPLSACSPVSVEDDDLHSYGLQLEGKNSHTASQRSISSAFYDHEVPLRPTSGSEPTSLVAISADPSQISGSDKPHRSSLQSLNPFSRSRSFPAIYQSQSRSPTSQMRAGTKRRASSLASPIGSSSVSAELFWDHKPSQIPEVNIPLTIPQLSQPCYDAPDVNPYPENFHFSTVQNIFAPELHLNSPREGQWYSFPEPSFAEGNPNPHTFPLKLNTGLLHEPLTTRPGLRHPPSRSDIQLQSLLSPQDFCSLQSETFCQAPSFSPTFVNHRPPTTQYYQTQIAQDMFSQASGSPYLTSPAPNL